MILAIDKQFDKEAHRAIPTVELGIVGHTRHGIPHIEVHTIAHTDSIDGHGIEHPRLIPSQAKEVGVELFTLTIHHLNGKRFLIIMDVLPLYFTLHASNVTPSPPMRFIGSQISTKAGVYVGFDTWSMSTTRLINGNDCS